MASAKAHRYVVSICDAAYGGQMGQFVNKDTAEVLIIVQNGFYVEVERKSMDHKS